MKEGIYQVDEDGSPTRIRGIEREDWTGLDDPCPECGTREFVHFWVDGGHFGQHRGVVIERADFWDARRPLATRCKGCGVLLFKHPAFDLLFGDDETGDSCSGSTQEFD